MKALLIASVILFSLRAMSSSEIGEDKKSPCPYADQGKREAKVVIEQPEESKEKLKESGSISK
jgi:hypothetical protein